MGEHPETWKPVVGYEGVYEVSDHGAVRSLPRKTAAGRNLKLRALSPRSDKWGHLWVRLTRDGAEKTKFVHRLVLEAFSGPCPPGMVGCHRNDIAADNRLENLRWDTPSANRFDQVRNGKDYNARKRECIRGHPFDAANTIYRRVGRACVKCQRMHEANSYAKRVAKRREEVNGPV